MAIVPSRKTNKYQFRCFDSIKAGDKLRVKSINWFIQNKETEGVYAGCVVSRNKHNDIFSSGMAHLCGKVLTVSETFKDLVRWPTRTVEDESKIENVIRVKSLDNYQYTAAGYDSDCDLECVDPATCTWHDWMFEGGPDIP
jgi:hypothetical protein